MMSPWILAIRPKTLPAAVAPVMIGTAMAFGDGVMHGPSALAALSGALCIQIGTNLVNDYCDFKKGADTKDRLGPVRVTQAGLIKPENVLKAAVAFFVMAACISLYLVDRAGMPMLMIGIASILAGIFYTAGKRSLAYLGWGEVFVFIFFGPTAVAGTYFVQTLDMNWAVLTAGLAPGFLSMAILAVNNVRDMEGDRKANKLTLAVRFGRGFGCGEFVFCMMGAMLTPFIVNLISNDHQSVVAASLIGFLSIPLIRRVYTSIDGVVLNSVLVKTGQMLLIYSVLFSAGWILCSR